MARRHYLMLIAALFIASCDAGGLPTQPSHTTLVSAPTTPTLPLSVGTAGLTDAERAALLKDPKASCPDGHYPERFVVSGHHGDDVYSLSWKEVPGVSDYQIEIERYPVGNAWAHFVTKAEDRTTFDFLVPDGAGGRFRAMIRTRVCDTQYGPWSPWLYFSGTDQINPVDDEVIAGPLPPGVPPIPGVPPPPPGSFYSLGPDIAPFSGLAGSAITCTASTITGDVGVSPGSSITGIPGLCSISGSIRSSASSAPAQAALSSAYAAIDALACIPISSDLNGQLLTPGVYCVPPATFNLTSGMTLSGAGAYTFRFSSTFITGAGAQVHLTGGATCGGVIWQVGSSATLAGSITGNVIAFSSITLNPGATLTGRALARNAAVTMTTATLTNAGCQ